MRGGAGAPAFSWRGGGRGDVTSLRARDADGDRARGRGRGGRRGRQYGGRGRGRSNGNYFAASAQPAGAAGGAAAPADAARASQEEDDHVMDSVLGFPLVTDGEERLGWLMNLNATVMEDRESGNTVAAVNCYFMCQDGSMFKAQVAFAPYFYLHVQDDMEREVEAYLRRKHPAAISAVEAVAREDLDLKNHLSGLQRRLLKVSFWTVQALMDVKHELAPAVRRNRAREATTTAYAAFDDRGRAGAPRMQDALDAVLDIREHDVPYHMRYQIDSGVRCGYWYAVRLAHGRVSLTWREDLVQRAEPRICAFDIETTKLPLQFPNAEFDQVFMISYMIDKCGYLIVNREVVSEDIADFEYTPKPEFEGPFTVWNEPDEGALLRRWFAHMREVQPAIYVTYNGDFFDWPFLETRATARGLDMHAETGFRMGAKTKECLSRSAVHMDCMHWVNRDSYLPQGSRGLKAVTKAKLGYNPVEVDPEDMVRFAAERPQTMAAYSVSDAVATFYLYQTYIHPFIFSLSTIIPMPPDEVLRKGSGTLCEMLLMVQAFQANVLAPNKHTAAVEAMHHGHLLESETYIGGKVEALESGVFRSDLPTRFKVKPAAYQKLLDSLDDDLRYAIEVENKQRREDIENYEEVRDEIAAALEALRDTPNREECPLIYHLDVAAMYPNIILTNRLQPSAIVTDEDCAACAFNRPGKTCLRPMAWTWRGESFSATAAEYYAIKTQLASETFAAEAPGGSPRFYGQLPQEERAKLLKDRLKKYCQRVYKRVLNKPVEERREAGVCMRENDFYVGTVRAFRDRRYEYKGLNKTWKGKLDAAKASGNQLEVQAAADMVVLYDSLQLAHKCILNSFYGYVMRRGARWYSMEMAGVVTFTGAQIIQRANQLVDQLGMPLELDTDGIWCALPGSFPENFMLKSRTGKDLRISYPCVMLNVMVAAHCTNDQYADLKDAATHTYETSSQMSIEFEVDGPYRAMILPASKEEGKLIKKRYAVFNPDGSLAELKGFELKRRGELKLIKVFQSEVFEHFLAGDTLEECYAAVAAVANRWLDLLDTQGVDVTDSELMEYISESSMMSKALAEYEGRKSCAVTTAQRLGQFLGDERIQDKGLNCNYVIARRPEGAPTSARAIPVAIFSTEPAVARSFLRKWTGELSDCRGLSEVPDVRAIVDWGYYKERLGSAVQKIITIPAAMQRVANPVPRVKHPDWLHKKVREKEDRFQQRKINSFFAARQPGDEAGLATASPCVDMEDMAGGGAAALARQLAAASVRERAGGGAAAGASGRRAGGRENAGDVGNLLGGGDEEMEDVGPCPDRSQDYAGWIGFQKRKWRTAAAARKRRRLEAAKQAQRPAAAPTAANVVDNVGAFFRTQAAQATHSHWQIVQLTPTHTPGLFRAWVLTGAAMYAVPLRVPRVFYVNSALPPDAPESPAGQPLGGVRVRRTLPFGREPLHLYQVTMEDAEFRRRAPEVALALAAPHVRDVFEERLPLAVDAALAMGCCAAVGVGARTRPLAEGFDRAELEMRTTTECAYLSGDGPDGLGALRYAALYASWDATRARAVFALHLPMDARVQLVVVAAAGGARDANPTAAKRHWRDAHAAGGPAAPADGDAEPPAATFEVAYVRSAEDAYRSLQAALAALRQRHRGPLAVVVEVLGGLARLARAVPALDAFPSIEVPAHSADGAYPSLGWQPRATQTAVKRIAAHGPWLRERAEVARYCHLPVGRLGPDWVLDAADALFGRSLRDAGHLLWAADPALPDIAGRSALAAADAALVDEAPSMEVAFPGAYRCVCVRLKLSHLAVAAIVKADMIGELEGAGGAPDADGCGPAFKILRQLALRLLTDAAERNNRLADEVLRNMWRWLCSPAAALATPPLQRHVARLMRKLLAQLVADLRRLGAQVVCADAAGLTLATGKRNLTAAVGYVDYLLEALKRRELFQWLILHPESFMHTLLFRDRFNFMAVRARLPERVLQTLSQHPGALTQGGVGDLKVVEADNDELKAPDIEQVWTVKDYLPKAVQELFLVVVTEFVLLPWREALRCTLADASQGGSQAAADAKGAAEAQTAWLRAQMGPHFSRKLLQYTRDIQKHISLHDGNPDNRFPYLAGSHLSEEELGTPALAFVRAVCEVLRLDASVEAEVGVLRRNLLRLTHTREFAHAAAFKEPCRSFVLRDVICAYCNACADLDLCRDPNLQEHNWACASCSNGYDLAAVEAQLLAVVRSRTRAYQTQDLRCLKCKQVGRGHLRRCCDQCGGELACTQSPAGHAAGLAVFRGIARFHGFELLAETVEWLLEVPGAAQVA
ncbi:hypothetical protein WJX81_001263 [Elliptochloris bilobata]|uniref:DNA polymerase epsilon catalytic subunit n=1 Tax=Elliptochloris bilobata TaxID=381761 RepID=A0AAW1RAX5_9CHLO